MATDFGFPAYAGDDDYLFISYASAESSIVSGYAKYLNDCNINVWYDNGLKDGQNWLDALLERIGQEHCKGVVFFISHLSVSRPFVQAETHEAFRLGKPIYGVFCSLTLQ